MVSGGFLPRDERDARAWNLKFRTLARSVFFCVFGTEKCCVEIEFKAYFRDFLRYGLYGSCGRDKLSKAGEFYLRGCKVSALRLCVSVFVVSHVVFEFCAVFGILYFVYVPSDVCFARTASFARHPALSFCAACIRVLRTLSASRRFALWRFACRFVCRLVPLLGALRVAPYAPYSAAA